MAFLRVLSVTITVVIFCVALFGVPQNASAAFGISPPFVNVSTLVPGSRYTQTIFLVQDQPNEDLPIQVNIDIPEPVRSWFSFTPGERFFIPKGVRQFGVGIEIRVPKDAALGVYHGTLTFTTAPSATGQVTIALGAQLDLNLRVGDDIVRDFSIPLVRPLDIEEGWDPRVQFKARNDGNVSERFDGGTFEVYDQFGAARLVFVQKQGKELPEVPAFTTQEFVIEFPTDLYLGIGQYWASITLIHDGKVVGSMRTVFNVLKRGSLSSPTERFLRQIRENWPYYAGGGAAVLILAGWFTFRKRKRTRASA